MMAGLRKQPVLCLCFLVNYFVIAAVAAGDKTSRHGTAASKGHHGKAAASSSYKGSTAHTHNGTHPTATDLTACEKKLEYAQQLADNAESDMLEFRKKHETAMAECATKKRREDTACQQQMESLRIRLNEELKKTAELDVKVLKLLQKHESASDDAATQDFRRQLDETRVELGREQHINKQHETTQTLLEQQLQKMQVALKQQGIAAGGSTVDKAADLLSDLGTIYMSCIQIAISFVPFIRPAIELPAAASPSAIGAQWEKMLLYFEPLPTKLNLVYNEYAKPHVVSAATWASHAISNALSKMGDVANSQLDAGLDAVYVIQPQLRHMFPTSIMSRFMLLLMLVGCAYVTGVVVMWLLGRLYRYLCRRRRRPTKIYKKTFAADSTKTAAATAARSEQRTFFGSREKAQTPQPAPSRPFDLDKRRKPQLVS